jgi:hypothetical protein
MPAHNQIVDQAVDNPQTEARKVAAACAWAGCPDARGGAPTIIDKLMI